MADLLSFFDPSPLLVWGLVPRALGLIYVLALASLLPQVVPMIGSRGVAPISQRLARMRQDYPGIRRFFDMPTLLWLNQSDAFLRFVPCLGIALGLLAVYGGEGAWWALLGCWICFLSLDGVGLVFPWDCMLLEAGFLAFFLPPIEALPTLQATALPLPAVSFMFRLLVIRLMLGFAKQKFVGSKFHDSLYLRGFFTWMPMPNPIGWYAQHGPRWFLRQSYYFMFVVEVLLPFCAFVSGGPRLLACAGLVALMLGIWATGNWGFFNLAYIGVCLCLLDLHASIFDITDPALVAGWSSFLGGPVTGALWSSWDVALTNLVMCVLCFGSLVYFPFNSWVSQTWIQWPYDDITWKRPWLDWLVRFFRALAPFRVLNSYGVFPPQTSPPLKLVPVIEGSADGENWRGYRYRFMPTEPGTPPRFIAPHHPRTDHAVIYAGAGMSDSDLLSTIIGAGKPYAYSPYSHYGWLDRMAQRLLEGEPSVLRLLGNNPFPDGPPRHVRVGLYVLTPTSLQERRRTGNWWRRGLIGELLPARESDPGLWERWLPRPECFHPDHVHWRRRAPSLRAMVDALAGGAPADEAVRAGSDLDAAQVAEFWELFVPAVGGEGRGDWKRLGARAEALRARFGRARLEHFERILERFVFMLRGRVEPHYLGARAPKLALPSNLRLHLLLQEVVVDGRAAYQRMLAEPALSVQRAASSDEASTLDLIGLLRPETLRYHVRTFRTLDRLSQAPEIPIGVVQMKPFISADPLPGHEWFPECHMTPEGDWIVKGFEPSA